MSLASDHGRDITLLDKQGGAKENTQTLPTTTPSGAVNPHIVQNGNAPVAVYGTDHIHKFTITGTTVPPFARIIFIMKI